MTTVLTVNTGSGSLKAHLVDADTERVLDAVAVEQSPDSDEAGQALDKLLDHADRDVAAVGHRLVHGGPDLRTATVVDEDAVAAARRAESLAPLHLPPALRLLDTLRERLPEVPHVLCPDTAFHADLPDVAATYPLPRSWRERHGLRRYGFHGLPTAGPSTAAANSVVDVAMNVQGVELERRYGRPVLSSLHAGHSAGMLVGGLAGTVAAAGGVPVPTHLAVVAAAGTVLGVVVPPGSSRRSRANGDRRSPGPLGRCSCSGSARSCLTARRAAGAPCTCGPPMTPHREPRPRRSPSSRWRSPRDAWPATA